MWGRLDALPAMEFPPAKRRRSSKFDTRHRHGPQAQSPRSDGIELPLIAESVSELEAHDSLLGRFFGSRRNVPAGNTRHGQVQGRLERKQVASAEVAVTIASTAIVQIEVDASGNPTGTSTTTLATGLSTSTTPSSTSVTTSSSSISSTSSTTALSSSSTPTTSSITTSSATISSSISVSTNTPSSSLAAPATSSTSSTLSSQSAQPATLPSTTSAASSTSSISSSSVSSSQTTTASSVPVTSPDAVSTSPFASLTATNGTTTSGLSLESSSTGSITAFGSASTAALTAISSIISDTASLNASAAGVHTSHSGSTSDSRSSLTSLTSSDRQSATLSSAHSRSTGASSTTVSGSFESGIGGASGTAGTRPSATGNPNSNSTSGTHDDSNVAPPGTIAGSVVGSVAGAALVVVALLFLFRMYKRRQGLASQRTNAARQLGVEDPFGDPPAGGPSMAQHGSAALFSPAAVGWLSRLSRHTEPEVPPAERGFQKVSGRKLPSAFSPGMEGPPPGAGAFAFAGPAAGAARSGNASRPNNSSTSLIDPATVPANPFNSQSSSNESFHETSDWVGPGPGTASTAPNTAPGTASTGLTHFVPEAVGASFGRERYASSHYSTDANGARSANGRPDLNRQQTETLLPSPARTPVIQKPSPFGRTSHVPPISSIQGTTPPEGYSSYGTLDHGFSPPINNRARFDEGFS